MISIVFELLTYMFLQPSYPLRLFSISFCSSPLKKSFFVTIINAYISSFLVCCENIMH